MGYDVTIFGIHFFLKPVAFTLPFGKNGWDIYWYGIIIAIGFLLALIYATKNCERFCVNSDRMLDVVLVTTPVAILCARTYYVIFDGEKLGGIKDFFGFSESSGFAGLAIYGGVIGAFLCGALMCRLRKVKMLDMFDMASVCFLIGQGIGRWGNFVNQEAYGSFTGSDFWGMQSTRTIAEVGEGLVHPCFLYESIWCIAGFFVLNYLSKKRKFSGQIILSYCAWYGFGRFFIELLRTDSLFIGNIKVSCLVSAFAFLASISLLVYNLRKYKENVNNDVYEDIFDEMENDTEEMTEEENGVDFEGEEENEFDN